MRKYVAMALVLFLWGCGKTAKVASPTDIDEPDRVLYQKALMEMDRHNYTGAQLLLQTLISSYQDSEYFPKAKYALAESMYREGGREKLDSAEAAYKDFIVYFRDSDLADDAQLMVAMTHVRRVQGPDRDNTEARLAELELKEMITSYPDSDLLEEAKTKLREVDEVLAAGSFKIANQYLRRKNAKASIGRYVEIEEKWPDFSQMDLVLFNHGEAIQLAAIQLKVKDDVSGKFYTNIVSNYPYSSRVELAKQRLMDLKLPIPPPNPVAPTRPPQPPGKSVLGKTFGVFKSHPAVPRDTKATSVLVAQDKADDKPEDKADKKN